MVKRKARTMKFRRKRSHNKRSHNKRSQNKRSQNKRSHTRKHKRSKHGGGTPSRLNPNAGPRISPVKSKSRKVEMRLGEEIARISIERKKAEEAKFKELTERMERMAQKENDRALAARKSSNFVAKSSSRRSKPSPTMASLTEEE